MKTQSILMLLLSTLIATGEEVTLRSNSGSQIVAEILSVDRNIVEIERSDGTKLRFPLIQLDEASQALVAKWQRENIPAKAFAVSMSERRVDKRSEKTDSMQRQTDVNVIKFTVSYKHSVELNGLTLKYKIICTREKLGMQSGEETTEIITGELPIERLTNGSRVALQSKQFELHEAKLEADYYFEDGGKNDVEDDVEGIWGRIYKGDKLIYEFSRPGRIKDTMDWNAPADGSRTGRAR